MIPDLRLGPRLLTINWSYDWTGYYLIEYIVKRSPDTSCPKGRGTPAAAERDSSKDSNRLTPPFPLSHP